MSDREDRLARAGDYVLGLLSDSERAEMDRAMQTDVALRDAVSRLAANLQALDDTVAPETPSAGLWTAITAAIASTPQQAAPSNVAPLVGPARTARKTWQPMLMAASVLVAAGVGYVVRGIVSPVTAPVVVVVLENANQTPGAIFEAFADDTVRIVPLEDFAVPEGKILQVWTLYDADVGPVSLGTLPRAEPAVLNGPEQPLPKSEQLYEITLEPAPGSPTGKPTGPILVKGFAQLPAR